MELLYKYYFIDWLWYAASLWAIYLLGNKSRNGFILLILSDIIGFGVAWLTGSIATAAGSLIYLVLGIRGWVKWGKKPGPVKANFRF